MRLFSSDLVTKSQLNGILYNFKNKKMKATTTDRDFLTSLVENYDFTHSNLRHEEYLITNFERLKSSSPFSNRLNKWVFNWFKNHESIFVFTQEDDFDMDLQATLNRSVELFERTNKIIVNSNNCQDSIYGDQMINLYARSIHEYCHIKNNLSFNFFGESLVANLQASMLPNDWFFEKKLILIDVIGQLQYFHKHKEYVINQRKFCIDYMVNPIEAVFNKQIIAAI